MSFLYSLFTFLQPGILWPGLAAYKPIIIISVLAVIIGLIKGSEYPRSYVFSNLALKYLVVFVVIQIISVYYSGASSVIQQFVFWYKYIAFVLVSVFVMTSINDTKKYIYGILFGGEVIVIYGIFSVIFEYASSAATGGMAGAYGMYENHNDYTFIIILMLPFTYMLRKTTESGLTRSILTFILITYFIGMFLSLSRGGMIALVFELGLLYLYTTDKKIGLIRILFISSLAISAIAAQFIMRSEHQGDVYTSEDSKSSRFELWVAGKNMFLAHPLLGVGSQRFNEFSRDYGEISHDNWGKNSHNTYVEIIAGTGLLGILTFFGFIKHAIRQLREISNSDEAKTICAYATATLVSLYSILLRSFFDAKVYDWSFYTLGAITICLFAIYRKLQDEKVREIA